MKLFLNRCNLRGCVVLIGLGSFWSLLPQAYGQEATVRSQAVVQLSFDEPNGAALDSAVAGSAKDYGTLAGNPVRVSSPYWGHKGKQALQLDAAAKQYVQIADSADVDRPDGLSLSMLYLNLHPASDAAFHGLLGKRDDMKVTNYGINYQMSADLFQVYLNAGAAFRTVTYSAQAAVGYRRRNFLTVTIQRGDAPVPDADADADDLLIRLFVNGKPLVAKAVVNGAVVESDAWLYDVPATLVNDVPLTVGSSTPMLEYASGVLDEFSLFPKALSPEEAVRLFREVAGPVMFTTSEEQAVAGTPEITTVSQFGLQLGQTTMLVITGANLAPDSQLLLPPGIEKQVVRPTSNANRLEVDVTLAANLPTGCYPLRVRTLQGVSNAVAMGVDALPQIAAGASTPDKPITLPAAISGTLSGQQQSRTWFMGQAGQRFVAELECKRLGAAMSPVLELKNARGAPLNIQWGRPAFDGDPRIETTLPVDGLYSIELHDLSYAAQGRNDYRLLIGDLKIADVAFPPAVVAGTERPVQLFGPGADEPLATLPADVKSASPGLPRSVAPPSALGLSGPAPRVLATEAVEISEESQANGQFQSIDAQFAERPHVPVGVNGRIAKPDEVDTYVLQVKPGVALNISATSALRSTLSPQISVTSHPEGAVLAASEDKPVLDVTPPAAAVRVVVKDVNGHGGPRSVYRLRIAPANQPEYSLNVSASGAVLARDGTAALRVDVTRAGYGGPVKIALVGAPDVAVSPAEIPAGVSKAFLTLAMANPAAAQAGAFYKAQLVGESLGLNPPLRRGARNPGEGRLAMIPDDQGEIGLSVAGPAGLALEVGTLPPAFYKGIDTALPVSVAVKAPEGAAVVHHAIRLTLLTTESARQIVDPTDPGRQRKISAPLVRSAPGQALAPGEAAGRLQVLVPLDIGESDMDCVIRAEVVPHAYSESVLATTYSRPFRISVLPVAAIELAAKTLNLTGNTMSKFRGTVKRSGGYSGTIEVALLNMPADYSAPKVTLPPGQEEFEIVVTAPASTASSELRSILFRATNELGGLVQADVPIVTMVAAGQ